MRAASSKGKDESYLRELVGDLWADSAALEKSTESCT